MSPSCKTTEQTMLREISQMIVFSALERKVTVDSQKEVIVESKILPNSLHNSQTEDKVDYVT